MTLVAISVGISLLFMLKVVLGWSLSFLIYKIAQLRHFCCGERQRYQRAAYYDKLGIKRYSAV